MLVVRGLCVSFGDRDLLLDVSFTIAKGERVALLGDNGSGKSTLLRVLAGESAPSRLDEVRYEDLRRTAYVAQSTDGAEDPASSGQRMRRRLQSALAGRPDLLLLDEPTNHLDDQGLLWLERELRAFPGAILFACHDRAFIDAVADRILLIDQGRLTSFPGGYQAFEQHALAAREAQRHQNATWRRERDRLHASAARQRAWAEKAHRMAGERNPVGKRKAAQLMHKAIAAERRVARHEADRVDKPWEEPPLSFAFQPPRGGLRVLARAQDLAFTYAGASRPALGPVTFDLRRGERLAIVGGNGSGKTTLLGLLSALGGTPALPGRTEGRLSLNPGLKVFHLRQEEPPPPQGSPLEIMLRAGAPDVAVARTVLGHFHLRGEMALRSVSSLSPGEQVRLQFCRCLVAGADLLLLDEPTNHLDLTGRSALGSALAAYPGAVVFASHDRSFRSEVATRELALGSSPAVAAAPEAQLRREMLEMRLAELTARLNEARGVRRAEIERTVDAVVQELAGLAQRERTGP